MHRGIRRMADGGRHCEGQDDERDVAMPTRPGAGFVAVEPQRVLCSFKAIQHVEAWFVRKGGKVPDESTLKRRLRNIWAKFGPEGVWPSRFHRGLGGLDDRSKKARA